MKIRINFSNISEIKLYTINIIVLSWLYILYLVYTFFRILEPLCYFRCLYPLFLGVTDRQFPKNCVNFATNFYFTFLIKNFLPKHYAKIQASFYRNYGKKRVRIPLYVILGIEVYKLIKDYVYYIFKFIYMSSKNLYILK